MRNLLFAAGLAGLAAAGPAAAQEADYDAATVLATVDGTEITLGHLIALLARLPEQYQEAPDEVLYDGMIEQLIDQTVLANRQSASPGEDPAVVRLTLENERRAELATLELGDMAEMPVDEAEARAAYDESFAAFEATPEYNASHILVESEEAATALRQQIDDGGDFAELAQSNSTDGSASAGGELGWFGLGRMVPEFEEAVASLQPGEVAGPVQTQFGWHLIKLNDVRESAPPPFEQVRPQIEDEIRQEAVREQIAALRGEAQIELAEEEVPPAAVRETDLLSE